MTYQKAFEQIDEDIVCIYATLCLLGEVSDNYKGLTLKTKIGSRDHLRKDEPIGSAFSWYNTEAGFSFWELENDKLNKKLRIS
jgi:hypothetical protein